MSAEAFDVHPLTLRFRDPELERGYARAWGEAMRKPIAIALLLGALNNVQGLFTDSLWLHDAHGLRALAWYHATSLAYFALGAAVLWVPRFAAHLRDVFLAWTLPGVASFVYVATAIPPSAADRIGTVLIVLFAALASLARLGFARNAVVAAAIAAVHHRVVPLVVLDADHRLGDVFLLYVAVVLCLVGSYGAERRDRRLFFDERLLAERSARKEAVLDSEIRHQVAARSRELGQRLEQMDVTLVVDGLEAGRTFAERYEVRRLLGTGGMGAVYEVDRRTDGARLALKIVKGQVSATQAARFAREAEIGSRVRHANVVSIVDVGIAGGTPYLAMELAEGALEAQRERFGDAAWARPILAQMAEGVAALHHAGVVHRDLKPGNVLFARDAAKRDGLVARISDFGISRLGASTAAADPAGATLAASASSPAAGGLTATGMFLGTPVYMAPEAAQGGRAIDTPADVFAFGVLACEMLTGRPPFSSPAFLTALAGESIGAPRIALADPALQALLVACLSAEPSARPSMREVADALR